MRNMKLPEELEKVISMLFPPSRDKMFPSEEVKDTAIRAIKILWFSDGYPFAGKKYSGDEIRYILEEKLMPEHLEFAIDDFVRLNRIDGINILIRLIFIKYFTNDELMEDLAKYDLIHKNKLKKGDAA